MKQKNIKNKSSEFEQELIEIEAGIIKSAYAVRPFLIKEFDKMFKDERRIKCH